MIMGNEELKRVEELKHSEKLLFKILSILDADLWQKHGYFGTMEIYRTKFGMTDKDLEYYGLIDYDMEMGCE